MNGYRQAGYLIIIPQGKLDLWREYLQTPGKKTQHGWDKYQYARQTKVFIDDGKHGN